MIVYVKVLMYLGVRVEDVDYFNLFLQLCLMFDYSVFKYSFG